MRPEYVEQFATLFNGRQDAFGLMQEGKTRAVRRPVSLLHYRLHLEGKIRLGIYPLLPDGSTRFLALDFDGPDAEMAACQVFQQARLHDIPFAWEISKSRGCHLWIFFKEPMIARDARILAKILLDKANVKAEIFPKQDRLPANGLGNFIWLPLSGESVRQGRTLFVDPDTLAPKPDQQVYLTEFEKCSPERMKKVISVMGRRERESTRPLSTTKGKIFSGDLLPCAKRMLEGVGEGCRDMAAFRLAIHLKSRGHSIQETEQLLQEWNATRNRPPLLPRDITTKLRSAYLRGYSGFGCEDPLIIPFCEESCPIKKKIQATLMVVEGSAL